MKKWLGFTIGGLQQKILNLVLVFLLSMIAVFGVVSYYQSRRLAKTVGNARDKQQAAIEQVSENTMLQVIDNTMVKTTALQAYIADDMFSDVRQNVTTLQSLAKQLFEHKHSIQPRKYSIPDASKEGKPTAQVLCESGVDINKSEYLGIAAHMSDTMIALYSNSDKLSNCFFGLADGTHLCIDEHSSNKFNEKGELTTFPVRERPWYKAAVEKNDLCFSGIETDTYTGSLCVTCSAPVYVDGKLIGVVGADMFLDSMSEYVDRTASETGSVCVVNSDGQLIFSPKKQGTLKIETSDKASDLRKSQDKEFADFVTRALKEQTKLTVVTIDGKSYYAAGSPMKTIGWTVITIVDKQTTELPTKQMLSEYDKINDEARKEFEEGTSFTKQTTLIMIALLLILGTVSALWVAGKIVKPVETMTADIIGSGETGKLFEMKDIYRTKDEIEVLAQSFDELSKKVRKYIEDITAITKEKERISTELELARKIQADMLPNIYPAFPDRPEFDIYAKMDPAKEVGGDFYDFYLIDDDHLGIVIADVSGKGVPAALFMMMTRILIKNYALMGYSPAKILELTNNTICMNNKEDMFVTVWYGVLEISTGRITASNAGHEFPIIKKANGSFELFKDSHGFVVGGMEDMTFDEYEMQLEKGGMLFLYTDGVPEATNSENEMFGLDRLIQSMNEHSSTDVPTTLDQVKSSVSGFVGGAEQFDDLTMLAVTRK